MSKTRTRRLGSKRQETTPEDAPSDSERSIQGGLFLIVVIILGIGLAAAAILVWQSMLPDPKTHFEAALQALEDEDDDAATLELTALEGLPAFEPHRRLLNGALLVRRGEHEQARRELEKASQQDELRELGLTWSGRSLYAQHRFREAERRWKDALRHNPDAENPKQLLEDSRQDQSPARRFDRALFAIDAGDFETVRMLDALRRVGAYRLHADFLEATWLMNRKNYKDALVLLDSTRRHPELAALSTSFAGEALYHQERFVDAEQRLLEAVDRNPDDVRAHRWLSIWFYDQGNTGAAAVHLKRVSELDRYDPRPDRFLGLLYRGIENDADAIKHYREALRRNPLPHVRREILLEIAKSQVQLRQYEEALQTLAAEELSETKDVEQKADRLVLEADCLFNLGRIGEAKKKIDAALEIEADHVAGLNFADIATSENEIESAAGFLTQAVRSYPKHYNTHFKLAQAYGRLKRNEDAERHRKIAEGLKDLRDKYTQLHKRAMAEPSDAQLRYDLANMSLDMGDAKMGLAWYRACLAIEPDHQAARKGLESLQASERQKKSKSEPSPDRPDEEAEDKADE